MICGRRVSASRQGRLCGPPRRPHRLFLVEVVRDNRLMAFFISPDATSLPIASSSSEANDLVAHQGLCQPLG